MLWLLEESTRHSMETAHTVTDAQLAVVEAALGGPTGNADRVMVRSGDSATINIVGVMTSRPSWMAYYFGGGNTLYGDLESAIDAVESDDSIKSVEFFINSGGGEAQPAIDLGDKIAAMSKPTKAVTATAASAAYWAASQADEIIATSRASMVGSIGAVQTLRKPSESSMIDVTSTKAPNKRPDPETEEGKNVIRTELDQFHDLFATAVAVGRDVTVKTVDKDFGKGGMMLADQALAAGMIDSIGTAKTTTATKTTGATKMDKAQLQLEHPALLASIQAEAHAEGVAAETDRVKFHAMMGEKTGASEFALKACLEGKAKDDTECMVEYMTHGRNNQDLKAREEDETQLDGNNPASTDEDARADAAVASIFDRV